MKLLRNKPLKSFGLRFNRHGIGSWVSQWFSVALGLRSWFINNRLYTWFEHFHTNYNTYNDYTIVISIESSSTFLILWNIIRSKIQSFPKRCSFSHIKTLHAVYSYLYTISINFYSSIWAAFVSVEDCLSCNLMLCNENEYFNFSKQYCQNH